MPVFNRYPKLEALTGNEVLVLADASGQHTVTATASQIAGAPAVSTPTGSFYEDKGAKISRFADRVLIGDAASNPGLSDRDAASKKDWLSRTMGETSIGPWALQDAQCASVAQFGNSAFVAASRTSDAKTAPATLGFQPSSIGVASWGVADDTSTPTTTTAYAYYGEAWRLAGVNYQPTFVMELEAVNFGGLAIGQSNPYAPNVGGGVYGIQLGVGGGQTDGTSDAAAGMVFVSNPNSWQTGIVFGATSLSGTDGTDDGYASALSLARNHAMEWHTPEVVSGAVGSNVGAFVRSTVTERAKGVRQDFVDNEILFSNIEGHTLFSVGSIAAPNNALQVQAGAGSQAAGLYVQQGANGSANLGLFPAEGGELQISSPVSGEGMTLPTTADGGFLHININGSDYRIPLMSPAQVGS
ncbi:hypothetical protein J4P41_10435 [Gluconobacter sp. NFX36]|uniref:Uncharacterized protein n=1 Tax=Gluconobacter japonicus TaxID=376620 RepID=A0ABQ5WKM5_GLUJA|nr:hypothetical protein [Gluconobacter japonicus]GAP24699.1 hypothetical protein GLF_1581 [Gluconobacter frateurii NBRC 101659]KXV28710.1 hypothetical protein AD938_03760 [Gluconobacter japonicus]MBS1051448.1 hypothetical protein [Gluconobacter japonicus]GBR20585.1 hypothetical protein AA3271_0769 [Gluconobacter japonicus NBRC 3271]GLQ60786.1 hypothetical protein GCM10010937_25890 [Gluconobacter japonicus]